MGLELLNAGSLLLHLLLEGSDGLTQLVHIDGGRLELLLELRNELALTLHRLLDILHVLADDGLIAGSLHIAVCHSDATLGLIDAVDALLNLVERAHKVVQFAVFGIDDGLQRVALLLHGIRRALAVTAGGSHKHQTCHQKQLLHNPSTTITNSPLGSFSLK